MENMRMPELKALAREHSLRGYSRLRKAELIAFLQNNEIRPRDLHHHPHRGTQHLLHGCLLGNQIDLHRCLLGNQIEPHICLPLGCPRGVLLGNWNVNGKMKSDNPS